ncbi:MAG: chromosome segregation protein ScpA, partial [Planctomycetes bacterium]|nr:chromosome segregation protein ScpA [Planctomycetota bacterium]
LVSALGRVLKRKDAEKETHIRYNETPISVYISQISERVRKEGRVPFSSFFEGANRKNRIVNIFLAILELLRHQSFRAEQPTDFGEIWILPPLDMTPL